MKSRSQKKILGIFQIKSPGKEGSLIRLHWDSHRNNFGDILNPIIATAYSSKQIRKISKWRHRFSDHYFAIGSILQRSTSKTIVWGSGLISEDALCKEPPGRICAVRGPLTRQQLIRQGIDCPEVYGDPALLLPLIYKPTAIGKKYKLGIIPHYKDKSHNWLNIITLNNPGIKIIDVQARDPLRVVDEIAGCERIVSSSLHGIIVGDAYGIPSIWIKLSDRPIGKGFKYRDYFASVGRVDRDPLIINDGTTLEEILNSFHDYRINIDLNKLINSCPF
jgi:pyruvyltransferase